MADSIWDPWLKGGGSGGAGGTQGGQGDLPLCPAGLEQYCKKASLVIPGETCQYYRPYEGGTGCQNFDTGEGSGEREEDPEQEETEEENPEEEDQEDPEDEDPFEGAGPYNEYGNSYRPDQSDWAKEQERMREDIRGDDLDDEEEEDKEDKNPIKEAEKLEETAEAVGFLATAWPGILGGCGVILILAIVIFAAFLIWPDPAAGTTPGSGSTTVICVDPGHPSEYKDSTTQADYDLDKATWEGTATGGHPNGGAEGGGAKERVINQQVADLLVAELNSRGYSAVETKTNSETFMSNRDRGKFCQSKGAQLIIKVHNDDADGAFNGMTFWYPDKATMLKKSKEPGGFNEYPSKISDTAMSAMLKIKDIMLKNFVDGQKKYSYTYPSQIESGANNDNRGFGYNYDIPTTLLEMSNMRDSVTFITNPANQKKIVKAFADGVEEYIPPSTGGGAIDGVLDVPYWNQFRDNPTSCSDGNHWDTTGSVGCGATSATMVVQFITGKKYTPDDYNRDGGGNQWDCDKVNSLIKSKGVQYQCYVSLSDPETALKNIEKSIQKGYPGVVHMDPPYACSAHVMVVTGFDKDGNVYVNDPNCGGCGGGVHNFNNRYLKVGSPAGKNDLAPRAAFKAAMRSHYEYVK